MNPKFFKINLSLAAVFLFLFSFNQAQAQKQTARYNTSITSNTNGFYEYLPRGYSATGTATYPLIIMIHGMGEYGSGSTTSLPLVLKHGVPKIINLGDFPTSFTVNGQTHKFIVLTPQWKSQASPANVNAVIDYAIKHYKVNPKRIYLTGLSAGGGVVENVAADLTVGKRIAAVVEFCGTGSPSLTRATNIVTNNVAFWGIHNLYDDVVSSSKTSKLVDYIKSVKSTFPARKTIPNASGHYVWKEKYFTYWKVDNLNIYQWMLQYQRGTTTTTTNTKPVANAGGDKTITLPTNSVTLSGSGSDADGSISKYSWTKVSGPSSYTFSSTSSKTPTVSSLAAGTYVFRLTVTDNAGATDYDDVKVVVNTAYTTYTVPGKVEAENSMKMLGVQTQTTTDAGGGKNVGYIDLYDWMDYNIKTSASGTYNITFRVASGTSTGSQFQVKNSSGTVLTTVTVPATGGYQTWRNVTASVKLVSGTQTLRLYSIKAAGWNLNYMTFATGSTTSSTSTSVTKIEAENYIYMEGVQKQTTSDAGGGQNISYVDLYDWVWYDYTIKTAGTYKFTFRVAGNATGAKFGVFDTYNDVKTRVGTVYVPNTGGWQKWTNVTVSIKLSAGSHSLLLYSEATPGWNLNYFTFGLSTTTTSTALASDVSTTAVAEEESTKTATAMSVSPNPFSDRFVLQVNNPYTGTMKVQLIDQGGMVRKQFQVAKNAAGNMQTYLSAGTLPAGNYFVKVQIGEWTQSTQIVKL